jgi:arylsulfatase
MTSDIPISAAMEVRFRRRIWTGLRPMAFDSRSSTTPLAAGQRAPALLTGYYPQQIHRDALPELPGGSQGTRQAWARLLPQRLQAAGYRSYHSGKWHVDGPVLAGGFSRSLNVRNDGNFFTAKGNFLDDQPVEPAADESGYYTTIATVDHALGCLQEHQSQHAGTPFFQYLAFIAPHFPLHALPEDIARYRDRYLEGWQKLRAERHARQRSLGLVSTPLSALEREIGPPYHFPDAAGETWSRRDQSSAALGRTDARAAKVSGNQDGHSRGDD